MQRVVGLWLLVLAGAVLAGRLAVGVRRRGWRRGEATVLERRRVWTGRSSSSEVTARLRLEDGSTVEGVSLDRVDASGWSPGSVRPAWYDPRDPGRFTLLPPPGRGGGAGWALTGICGVVGAVGLVLLVL
jgi:Protein of unknown function (DUF3592)